MTISDIPLEFLRFQYRLARYPLQLIENQMMSRLDSGAPARLLYERSLGTLDRTFGRVLGDRRMRNLGRDAVDRVNGLEEAAEPDVLASVGNGHASDELDVKRHQVAQQQQDARDARDLAVVAARASAEDRRRSAADETRKAVAAARRSSDDDAARRSAAIKATEKVAQRRMRGAEQRDRALAEHRRESATGEHCKADGRSS